MQNQDDVIIAVTSKSDAHSNSPVKTQLPTAEARSSETREQSSSIPLPEQINISNSDVRMHDDMHELKTMVIAMISQAEKESETNANAAQELSVQLSKILIQSLDEKARKSLLKSFESKAFPKASVHVKVSQLEKKLKFIESLFSQ